MPTIKIATARINEIDLETVTSSRRSRLCRRSPLSGHSTDFAQRNPDSLRRTRDRGCPDDHVRAENGLRATHCVSFEITWQVPRAPSEAELDSRVALQLSKYLGVNENSRGSGEVCKPKDVLRQLNCMQLPWLPMSLIGTRLERSESEVMTAMIDKVMNDKDRFTMTELAALRNDLLQGGMIDSYEAAELLQVFLMGRGYGVSPEAALDAVGRVEMAGCALPVLRHELENLALVM